MKTIEKLDFSAHCVYCEGIDERIEEPVHHPSYEITTRCNLNCIFCYSKAAELKNSAPEPGYYGSDDPKAITISQFGEPFVLGTEKVVEIIRKLRNIFGEVRIDIQTNGTLLDPDLLGSEADIVMISLDAGSRESYVKITGADYFDKVVENISRMAELCYTVVRTVYMPGINDGELEKIAEIASNADELFLQPLSIYENEKLKNLDIEKTESMWDYLSKACKLSEIAEVRIPGCLLLNVRSFVKEFGFENLRFVRRNAFADLPKMHREWKFRIH